MRRRYAWLPAVSEIRPVFPWQPAARAAQAVVSEPPPTKEQTFIRALRRKVVGSDPSRGPAGARLHKSEK